MKKEAIRVFVADDHYLIRQGIMRILEEDDDICVVGEASDGEQLLQMIENCPVDVLLVDINMPKVDGITVLQKVRIEKPQVKAIILTIENDKKTIITTLKAGASGYMLKDSAGEALADTIRAVNSGEIVIDKSLMPMLIEENEEKETKCRGQLDILSQRELEVLLKISKGYSNKEIGEQLFLSEKTVKNYITNLFKKVNLQDRVHATLFALHNNIDEYYQDKYN